MKLPHPDQLSCAAVRANLQLGFLRARDSTSESCKNPAVVADKMREPPYHWSRGHLRKPTFSAQQCASCNVRKTINRFPGFGEQTFPQGAPDRRQSRLGKKKVAGASWLSLWFGTSRYCFFISRPRRPSLSGGACIPRRFPCLTLRNRQNRGGCPSKSLTIQSRDLCASRLQCPDVRQDRLASLEGCQN